MEVPHTHMTESTESLSASSFSLLLQPVLRQIFLFHRSGCTTFYIALSPQVSIVLTQYALSTSRLYKRTS